MVYPRVCGGTAATGAVEWEVTGLSPRVRGNRSSSPQRPAVPGVYPRVCGGTTGHKPEIGGVAGLSPRVRGNQPAEEQ